MDYKLVLGLEIHLHLKTKTKMFCMCDADIYNAAPNTHTCPVCLGLPGALPVPNFEAVEKTQILGLALNCVLNEYSRFDRKHYFYPDLPKGYQISQYKQPLCGEGYLVLKNGTKVDIERIHLEEDVAKSTHGDKTLIDFNKSSMPLVEIVTKPCFKSAEDAVEFCKRVQDVVRLLELGDVDMEKGQMRLEANISMRTVEMEGCSELPTYKVEVKNINSFRFMEKAVKAEIKRQTALLAQGQIPMQENRGYDEDADVTLSQRDKEQAHDYRYFPEPDIPPMHFDAKYLEALRKKLPQLPWQIREKLMSHYKLSETVVDLLTTGVHKVTTQKFEDIVAKGLDPIKVANLLLNRTDYQSLTVGEFVKKFADEDAKIDNLDIIKEIAVKVVAANIAVVETYKAGKASSIEFLVGQVMRETKGKAAAGVVREVLKELLV